MGTAPVEGWAEALMIADWPRPQTLSFGESAAAFERLRELVTRIRATRSESNVDAGKKIPAVIVAGGMAGFVERQREVLAFLARLDEGDLEIREIAAAPDNALTIPLGDITAYLPFLPSIEESNSVGPLVEAICRLFTSTWYAPMCCVMPPNSPSVILEERILSRSEVLPWST